MKTSKYKLKIVVGYRQDQEITIDANEAHKAYFLFRNPEKRGTFDNGVALIGRDIQRIVPDYHATMGWNPDRRLTDDDWNEIRGSGVMLKLRDIMVLAKEVAAIGEVGDLSVPLIELKNKKYAGLSSGSEFGKKLLESKNDHGKI